MRRRNRKLQQRIDRTMSRIQKAGGILGISDDSPDEIVSFFLDQIDDCPLCQEATRKKEQPPPGH
ncbi:MAG TPA: hypothetical protein VM557_01650 [Thermoanaerobaculia bacterium]|nr:hypothetical protein [Thermoanaerobaculia bacterium]